MDASKVKVLVAKYTIVISSAWIIPAEYVDKVGDELNVKYDNLRYNGKYINAQKIIDGADDVRYMDFKYYDDELIVIDFDENMNEEDVYYDCEDGYDENILEKVKKELEEADKE
jgi:hypothetical protein